MVLVSVRVALPDLVKEPVPAIVLVRVETAPVPKVPSVAWFTVKAVPLRLMR